MTSEKKLMANRRNARRSTGPRTPEDKARAARNAIVHGLLSSSPVAPEEDRQEFERFAEGLWETLRPEGAVERHLVESVISQCWRLRRLRALEAGIFVYEASEWAFLRARTDAAERQREADAQVEVISEAERLLRELSPTTTTVLDPEHRELALAGRDLALEQLEVADEMRDAQVLASAFIRQAAGPDAFLKLARYEAAIERSLLRNLHELERLRARRAEV